MEKYSAFNDGFFGINPFVNPTYPKETVWMMIVAILRFPVYLILKWVNVIPLLIRIEMKGKLKRRGVKLEGMVACNCASVFDRYVLRWCFGDIPLLYLSDVGFRHLDGSTTTIAPPNCIVFIEGCNTNNKAVLMAVRNVAVNGTITLRYTPSCIFMYGDYKRFVKIFLGSKNAVTVSYTDGAEDFNLPRVKMSMKDKAEFMKLVKTDPLPWAAESAVRPFLR